VLQTNPEIACPPITCRDMPEMETSPEMAVCWTNNPPRSGSRCCVHHAKLRRTRAVPPVRRQAAREMDHPAPIGEEEMAEIRIDGAERHGLKARPRLRAKIEADVVGADLPGVRQRVAWQGQKRLRMARTEGAGALQRIEQLESGAVGGQSGIDLE